MLTGRLDPMRLLHLFRGDGGKQGRHLLLSIIDISIIRPTNDPEGMIRMLYDSCGAPLTDRP